MDGIFAVCRNRSLCLFGLKEFLAQSAKGAQENMVIERTDHLEEIIGIFWHESQPNLGTQNRLVQICVPMGHGFHGFPHHIWNSSMEASAIWAQGLASHGIPRVAHELPTSCLVKECFGGLSNYSTCGDYSRRTHPQITASLCHSMSQRSERKRCHGVHIN